MESPWTEGTQNVKMVALPLYDKVIIMNSLLRNREFRNKRTFYKVLGASCQICPNDDPTLTVLFMESSNLRRYIDMGEIDAYTQPILTIFHLEPPPVERKYVYGSGPVTMMTARYTGFKFIYLFISSRTEKPRNQETRFKTSGT